MLSFLIIRWLLIWLKFGMILTLWTNDKNSNWWIHFSCKEVVGWTCTVHGVHGHFWWGIRRSQSSDWWPSVRKNPRPLSLWAVRILVDYRCLISSRGGFDYLTAYHFFILRFISYNRIKFSKDTRSNSKHGSNWFDSWVHRQYRSVVMMSYTQ